MKSFFLASAKIAVALILSVIALSLVAWGVFAFIEYRNEIRNADLAKAKVWPIVKAPESLKVDFKLKTTWRDGRLLYQFEVVGYPKVIENASRKSGTTFNLLFVDVDGFDLNSQTVKLNEMFLRVDDEGKPKGLEAQGKSYLSAEDYRRSTRWNVSWQGF